MAASSEFDRRVHAVGSSEAILHAASVQQAALEICAGVIAGPLPRVAEIPERDTLITTPWLHRELHEPIPPLPVHVIGTYYGHPAPRTWRVGQKHFTGTGRSGGIGVVPAHWHGHWDIDAEASLSYVMLNDARLQSFAEPLTGGHRIELMPSVAKSDPTGASLLRLLSHESANPDSSARLFVEQALDLLCIHLIRAHSSHGALQAPAPNHGLSLRQLRRVKAYIAEHLDRAICLDELANLTSLSRSYFCTAFRQATGHRPHEWLTLERIERSRLLLRDSRTSVTEIGLAVGYQTPSAFSTVFRRHTGMTPSEYRRSLL